MYNPDQNLGKKVVHKPEHVNSIWIEKFKRALINLANNYICTHKNSIRKRQIAENKIKLLKSISFEEKVQYFNMQIESYMRDLTTLNKN